MEWQFALLMIMGVFFLLVIIGMPIAFAFLITNLGAAMIFMGDVDGPYLILLGFFQSLAQFSLLPVLLFILMGSVLFESGLASRTIEAVASLIGRVPGRLSVLTCVSGTLYAIVSGSTMASTALLASTVLPEMQKKSYGPVLSFGPILASGGLAMVIPPSALAVIYATIAKISVGKVLIAGIIPGFMLAIGYLGFILVYSRLRPDEAPEDEQILDQPWQQKMRLILREIIPTSILVFLVTGVFFLGVATPNEASGLGAMGAFLMAAIYRRMNRQVLVRVLSSTIKVSGMLLFLVSTSIAFSQLLAYSGVTRAVVGLVKDLDWPPYGILFVMILAVAILGCFIDQTSIMMITIPIFIPIATALGFDLVWFAIIMLITLQIALTTPPFGLSLFIMKSFAPRGTPTVTIYKAALPYICTDTLSLILICFFPTLVLWLPSLMSR